MADGSIDEGGAIPINECGSLEEADGRERNVVDGAPNQALHGQWHHRHRLRLKEDSSGAQVMLD